MTKDGSEGIFMIVSSWIRDNLSSERIAHISAHEMSHVYHNILDGYREYRGTHSEVYVVGPVWLIEGAAEFQAIRSLAKGGLNFYNHTRNLYVERSNTVDATLLELETYEGVRSKANGYHLPAMAVELLASLAGEESVLTYWTQVRPGTTWQEAFEKSFGLTVEDFYTLFADHRAAEFPELDLPPMGPTLEDLPQVDRPALVALYNATGGADWENKTNWLSDAHIGRWHGVTINPRGRVVELRLTHNGLRGQLPSEMGTLTELTKLGLWANGLTGTIPSELASLTKLEGFSVGGNQLSGEIPAWLGSFSSLRELHLVSNQFSGPIPSWVGDLPLRRLYLTDNRLSGDIPAELGKLSGLRALYLDGNNLTGCIPSELRDVPDNDFDAASLPFCGQ